MPLPTNGGTPLGGIYSSSCEPLAAAEPEISVLTELEAFGSEVRRLPALRQNLREARAEGEFELILFFSHGVFCGTAMADASGLSLDDGVFMVSELSPRIAGPLRRSKPLFFFNTCVSGRLGYSLTGLGSWSARLIELGCGGFVGTLWQVTDRGALEFAKVFYRLLVEDRPIAEAVRLARHELHVRRPFDPSWLAYRCYADPNAHVVAKRGANDHDQRLP